MFLARLITPYIGMHNWTAFSENTFFVNADTEDEAIESLKEITGFKDPEVQEALQGQDGYKEDEYFSVYLHEILENATCIYIPPPRTGFPEPNKEVKF